MPRKRIVLLTFSVVALALGAASVQAGPRMTLPESYFNFGYIPQFAHVAHTFWLKSTGDSELVINEVVPGCGCTEAPLEKDHIAVGDSARLEIIFDSRRFRHRTTKQPEIKTNGLEPTKKVQIIANIVPKGDTSRPLMFEPNMINFFGDDTEASKPVEFKIHNLSDSSLQITLVAREDKYFKAELPSSIGPGETKTGKVTLMKGVVSDAFFKSFTIEVNDVWNHRFTMPIARRKPNMGNGFSTD